MSKIMPLPRRPSRVSQVTIKDGELEKAIVVPDGGKAWRLVGATFVCQMLCAGLIQAMGVTFVEFKTHFGATDTEISWIGSCLTFSACAMSVFSGALSRHFGCRPTVVFGGFLAAVSMAVGAFCQTLWQLYITVSLTGCGCGLALPAAISVIGFNFQVRFGIANGLQYAGVGAGIMGIPPLFQLMFYAYSWRGALLIYGSVLLNVCVCGLLLKPSAAEQFSLERNHSSYSAVPSKSQNIDRNSSSTIIKETTDDTSRTNHTRKFGLGAPGTMVDATGHVPDSDSHVPASSNGGNGENHRTLMTFNVDTIQISTKLQSDERTSTPVQRKGMLEYIRESFKKATHIIGVSILWEHPNFACFALAVMMFGFGYASCLTYFIPRAIQDLKIPKLEATLLLTVLGANSLAARLANGPIVDYGWISPMRFFCLSCFVCAVSSFCTPFTHTFAGSLVCAGLFGLASGVANPMLAMVSRKLVGQKVMASAIGLLMLFNGIGSVAGIYTMGYVFDHYGRYDLSFYIAGCDLLLLIVVVFVGKALTKKSPSKRLSTSSIVRGVQVATPDDSPSIGDITGSTGQEQEKMWKSVAQSPDTSKKATAACIESSV